ncbi:MAG: basic amino acid transporter substrate-binding protein [Thermoleophilia bacterium]|nr:basic amino acid transporter substrate-binding protein [Thermoleophilia bacterium]
MIVRWTSVATAVTALLTVGLLAAGCGSSDDDGAAKASPKLVAPPALAKRGTLVFCSDIGYPPLEFEGDDGAPAGADIEIGRALAKRMQLKAEFRQTGFDGILASLTKGDCDAVISAMTNNAERRKDAAFVDYLDVGQSLLVPTANEYDIAGLDDIEGRTIAVQQGTTNEQFLRDRIQAGDWKQAPTIKTFADDADAAGALATGTADAYFGDSPTAAYYIGEDALTYAFAGKPINAEPIGIAVDKSDHVLHKQLQAGIDAMYDDGAMSTILKRWKLDDFALDA